MKRKKLSLFCYILWFILGCVNFQCIARATATATEPVAQKGVFILHSEEIFVLGCFLFSKMQMELLMSSRGMSGDKR